VALSAGAGLSAARRQAPEQRLPVPEQRPANVSDRLEALHREADALMSRERTLLGDLRRLEVERDLRLEESRQLTAQASKLTAQAEETSNLIARYEQALEAARPLLRQRLVDMYKLGQPGYARLLLGTGDVRQLGRTTRLVTAMANLDQRRVRAYATLVSRLSAARKTLDDQVLRLETLQADAQQAADLASKAALARADLIRQIDARRDMNAQMAGELEMAARRLQGTMAAPGGASPAPGAAASAIKPLRGQLDWPVAAQSYTRPGRADQPGAAVAPNGLELSVPEGVPVRAIHEGRVVFADQFPALGQLIIIDHGGLAFSLYGYLGSMSVTKGTAVAAGQVIGASGSSPDGKPALYFELRIDGQPVDPLQWLKAR
jgi:septal ring factor EnvC (AmiA/AmiB activator)